MSNFKLFMKNISYSCTEDKLKEELNKLPGYLSAVLLRSGFGYIVFDTRENAEQVMKNQKIYIDGRKVIFQYYKNKLYSVFVKGLDVNISLELFKQEVETNFKSLASSFVRTNSYGGKYGILNFKEKEDYYKLLSAGELKIGEQKYQVFNLNRKHNRQKYKNNDDDNISNNGNDGNDGDNEDNIRSKPIPKTENTEQKQQTNQNKGKWKKIEKAK